MRLTVHTFLTLDGIMQAPGGAEEDSSGSFAHGGWLVPYADQDMGEIVDGWFQKTGAILIGATTYGLFHPFWSQVTDPADRVAHVLNTARKYVVSSSMQTADWENTTILRSLDDVRELKAQGGDGELQVHGSAALAASLHAAGLIDEYRLITFPVTIGSGKRLFTADAPASGYKLIAHRATSTGATYAELQPAPYVGGGSFAVVDGTQSVQDA